MRPFVFQLPHWLPVVGGRPLYSYGLTLAIALYVGWAMATWWSERDGIPRKVASNGLVVAMVAGVLGARLFYFWTSTDEPLTLANYLRFTEGGLVVYGGYLAGLLAAWAWAVWYRVSILTMWDNAAPMLVYGLGVARNGCFLFGCDYGVRTSGPLAVRYLAWDVPSASPWIPHLPPALGDHLRAGIVPPDAFASAPIFPTQLLASLGGFVLFGVLLLARRYRRFEGQTILQFLVLYSAFRFANEFLRGDASRGVGWFGTGLSTSQLIGLALIALAIAAWPLLRRYRPLAS